jgi:hypothetical protein
LPCEGHGHEELFICRALEFWFKVQTFGPCLLTYFSATVRFFFVEGDDLAEIDLLVEEILEGGGYVVLKGGVRLYLCVEGLKK